MTDSVTITKVWVNEENEVMADVEVYDENGGRLAPTATTLSDVLSALFEQRMLWKKKS